MYMTELHPLVSNLANHPAPLFQPGDLVVPRAGYPTLCEVIAVEAPGLLRIRGLEWSAGYSADVASQDVCHISAIFASKDPTQKRATQLIVNEQTGGDTLNG